MKFKLAFSFAFLLNFSCFSQDTTNLVPNWSFEINDSCPKTYMPIEYASNWQNANTSTPNYFSACNDTISDVPFNFGGFQYAKSGSSYSSIILYGSTNEREYISIKLNNELIYLHEYCFELYFSLANISCNSTQDLHVHFSEDSVFQNNSNTINLVPHISNNNSFFYDTLGWELMSGKYTAEGNENYLTIGNFYDDSQTQIVLFDTNISSCTYGGAHYYIDAVRLYDCTQPDTTVYETSLFPNPNNGIFTVNYNLGENRTAGIFRIYDTIGKLVYNENLTQNNGTLNLNLFLATGVYFWEIRDEENNSLRSDKIVVAD